MLSAGNQHPAMDISPSDADSSRIDAIRERWKQFDNTGDESLILDVLADDVIFLPPGGEPIQGKAAAEETLQAFPPDAYDVDHTSERLLVSGDLAVDYVSVEGTKFDEERNVTDDVSLKGIDVYRRESNEGWKIAFTIWNDQA